MRSFVIVASVISLLAVLHCGLFFCSFFFFFFKQAYHILLLNSVTVGLYEFDQFLLVEKFCFNSVEMLRGGFSFKSHSCGHWTFTNR